MKDRFGKLKQKLFHKDKQSLNVTVQRANADLNNDRSSFSTATHVSQSTNDLDILQARLNENAQPQGLWQAAYGKLTASDQLILSSAQLSEDGSGRQLRTEQVLERIIQATKEQYEAYQTGGLKIHRSGAEDVNLRDTAQKILDATLSFKDVISAVVAFDPTGHATSAWKIMTQNHNDVRNALFESSSFLADLLARFAYIERFFYHENQSETKIRIGESIIRVYTAILIYAVEVQKTQQANIGRKVLRSITAITDQPLSKLKSSIIDEEQTFQKWVQIHQYLHHETEAANILAQIDQVIISIQGLHRTFDLSKLVIAEGASFDSYMDQDEGVCLSGTRSELLQQIAEWAESPDGKCIYWLNGMAGTGKSTISRTIATSFQEKRILGASFFFKRGEKDRSTGQRFVSTITSHLITKIPQLIPAIIVAIDNDPYIASRSLREQFDQLLLQPLRSLHLTQLQTSTVVLVIDALDECDKVNDVRVILQLLPELQVSTAIRFRILLTSRPDLPMLLGFKNMRDDDHQDMVLQTIPMPVIEHDITLFLNHRFSEIRKDHSLPLDWPGERIIEKLVAMALPLFISAATVCLFVGDLNWEPQIRLERLLKDEGSYASKMDKTYLPILNQLLVGQDDEESKQLVQEFQDIIGVIILLANPLSLHALSQFLGMRSGAISNRLKFFHSVLSIPSDPDLPIRILHLSFRDFLLNSNKEPKSPFWVDKREKHQKIAQHCLRIMHRGLKKNICNLSSYGTYRTSINKQTINQNLPPALQYSCRYWTQHLVQGKDLTTGMKDAFALLQEHFIHWLEAISILGFLSEAVDAVNTLLSPTLAEKNPQLSEFLHDGKRFILKHMHIADIAPLQLYYSGLLFTPRNSVVRRTFIMDLPSWIAKQPEVEDNWGTLQQTLEGHSHNVASVAFSPDGRLLASGSWDATIKLWDPFTGALQQTIKGHSSGIKSVAFSVDGRLASGSDDYTIKLWDPATGALQQTFEGHSGWVLSVSFSPDGQLLASASDDGTIKLWDSTTGILQQTLKGHSNGVKSVAFSPDNRLLASSSSDKTIKLWNPFTGALQQTLQGHSLVINSVAFSVDGRLASGSYDKKIKLWDPITGVLQQTLEGHSHLVTSVAFSPDGRLLASGSCDKTIKLWDPTTGALQQTLQCHTNSISSIVFSPDGRFLASGSDDNTINFWDPTIEVMQQTLEDHSDFVESVAFSPNGWLLASASHDKTIKLWNSTTGALQKTLEGHSSNVTSVAFSSDGQLLASASDDGTIKLWDSSTGILQQTFKDHSYGVNSMAFSLDGRLASVSYNKTIKVWNPITGVLQQTLKSRSSNFTSVKFSPDGRLLVSGSFDNTIKLWDPFTGALRQTIGDYSYWVTSVAFSPDGQLLALGSNDNSVRLWNSITGALQQTLRGDSGRISSVAFSPDGRLLASSSSDKTIKLWDPNTGALQQILTVGGVAMDLKFSEDSPYLSTNLGPVKIQSWYNNYTSSFSNTNIVEVFICNNRWVTVRGEKILWLALEYEPVCSIFKMDGTIILRHASGRISFIRLCA